MGDRRRVLFDLRVDVFAIDRRVDEAARNHQDRGDGFDPTRRAQGHENAAELVAKARQRLLAEGTGTFIIAGHYGLTGLLTFYMPEARASLPGTPLVYPRTTSRPKNQFWFWPEYRYPDFRKGQNAIYVAEVNESERLPPEVAGQFTSVKDLGLLNVRGGKRTVRMLQLWECRGLR